MSKNLSRRDFLKLTGATSAGLALSACGVQPTALPTATFVSPTATPAPTNTPYPSALSTAWASDENTLQVDPRTMFLLVGGINHVNRYALDMTLDTVKLAVLQSQDLTQTSTHDVLRKTISLLLDSSAEFKKHALTVIANFAELDEFKVQNDFNNLTIVVEGEFVRGSVFRFGDSLRRYAVDLDGNIAFLEKRDEPPLLPELRVNGPYLERVDTGEYVILKGITLPINNDERRGTPVFDYVKRNIEANEKLGLYSNFVRLSAWTSSWSEGSTEQVREVADYLEQKGIYMVFTPHNDQRNDTNDNRYLPNEKDKQTVVDVVRALKVKSNVFIGLWNEPANTNWSQWSKVVTEMYERLLLVYQQEPMPLIMVPGIDWSKDFRGAKIPLLKDSYVIDVHPYVVPSTNAGFRHVDEMWTNMIGQVPIIITELSGILPADINLIPLQSKTDLDNMRRILNIVNDPKNKDMIGYAIWRGDGYAEGVRREFNNAKLSPRGELLVIDRKTYPQTDFTE